MSARDAMAAMLDELMGPQRNSEGWKADFSFKDESVCKYALAEFCPHDMFVHTKGDLGPCPKIHDDKLRLSYQQSGDYGRLGYEGKLLTFLERLDRDMKENIRAEKKKLQTQYGDQKTDTFETEIDKLAKLSEEAGERGDVEECKKYLEKIDKFRAERERQERLNEVVPHREMEICDICARRLIVNDAPQRVEEHLTGKMHVGYIRIAETITVLKERIEKYDAKSGDRGDRDREREREKDRERDRDRRKRSRSRDREKDRREHREREDGGRKRSRSRDRDRRSSRTDDRRRSRSRSRDRDRRRSRR